jgi:hypothetical protein
VRVILLATLLTPLLATAQTESQPACPTLARASFTTAVENREPTNTVSQVPANTDELLFYTEVHDGSNQTLYHHWTLNGEPFVDVTLEIGSDFWRTWSSKTLTGLGMKAGDIWEVSVTGAKGCELGHWQVTLTETGNAPTPTPDTTTQGNPNPDRASEPTPAQAPATIKNGGSDPVDLSANFTVIEELLTLGDSRGARSAIKRARALTDNAQQLAELDQMDKDNQAFAELNQLIRQRDISAARQKLQALMVSVPPESPVYPALQGRHKLLDQLNEMNRDSATLQAASTP